MKSTWNVRIDQHKTNPTVFPKEQPARAAFAVKALPANGKVEIECIAAMGK